MSSGRVLFPQYLPVLASAFFRLSCILLVFARHDRQSVAQAAENQIAQARPQPTRAAAGKMTSKSLAPRGNGAADHLFETLDPKLTGIDFYHRWNADLGQNRNTATGSGVAMGDYDGDGRVDVFLARTTDGGRLYRNLGNFRFADVTEKSAIGLGEERWTLGPSFADVDNDGDLDLYVCGYRCPNHLYVNQGNGTFQEQGKKFGLDYTGASIIMAWADYDLDGDLDGYLVTNHEPPPQDIEYRLVYDRRGVPRVPEKFREFHDTILMPEGDYGVVEVGQYDHFFRNNGDGTFTDVSGPAGIEGNDKGLAATWWDYDDDAYPDLYVANDFYGPDYLYRNNGDGTFTDVAAEVLPHTPWFSMGCDVGDLNNDGLFDFMGTDMSESNTYRSKVAMNDMYDDGWFLERPMPRQYMRNAVFLNTGVGRCVETAFLTGLESTSWTWSPRFVDLDQDGHVDVHVTNGMTRDWSNSDHKRESIKRGPMNSKAFTRYWDDQPPLHMPNLAFRNLGNLKFEEVGAAWGLDYKGVSFGAAFGDLDGDGDLDLVINNLDDMVSVSRNNGASGNAIRIRLKGVASNRWGIGATVRVRTGQAQQSSYLTISRGFMSSSDPTIHFGLGEAKVVDDLVVQWPSGHVQSFKNLPADRLYTITEPDGAPPRPKPLDQPKIRPMFARSDAIAKLTRHEEPFDDFARQPLLSFRLSQLGPGLAVGDVNADGRDEIFVGGPKGNWGALLAGQSTGEWADISGVFPAWNDGSGSEDQGAVLFDADADNDLDLYVASGSIECEPGEESLSDRLFLNDGSGTFVRAPDERLPDLRDSGSVVAAADYDRDGDLDLFVGSRSIPGRFPETPESRLLKNNAGTFRDAAADDAPELSKTGLVTSALWSDANGDGWPDLLVTHEWGPIKLYLNKQGKLRDATQSAGLADALGWWNGIAGRDLDGDGDIDYVATNLGRNSCYRVTADRPAKLFYGDFAGDGKRVAIEAQFDEQGRLIPRLNKPQVERALPFVEAAFPTYHEFASATLADIVDQKKLDGALALTANTVNSIVLRNDGQGRFTIEPLPVLAQVSPGYGIVMTDFDADGLTDVYIVQNLNSARREIGELNGGISVLLLGQENGQLAAPPFRRTGLVVPGDAKSVVASDLNGDNWPDVVVGVNNAEVLAFENQRVEGRRMASVRLVGRPGNPTAVGARVTFHTSDGRKQTAEVTAGGGYLSQQPSTLWFGLGPKGQIASIDVRWPDGETSRHTTKPTELKIKLTQPAAKR